MLDTGTTEAKCHLNGLVGGKTLLYLAVQNKRCDIVELLLKSGADVDSLIDGYKTPLLNAAFLNRVDIVSVLLQNKANVNLCFEHSISYLCAACSMGGATIAEFLINKGAEVNITAINENVNSYRSPPLVSAIKSVYASEKENWCNLCCIREPMSLQLILGIYPWKKQHHEIILK